MSFFTTSFAACRSHRRPSRLISRHYNSKPKESAHNLSRTERRSMMRKQKNRERRQTVNPNANTKHTFAKEESLFSALVNRIRFAHPKVPAGGNLYFTRQHLKPLLYRVPFATILFLLVTNDEYFPYIIQGSIGPSMLPTIQYIGDLWLIETWAWHRLSGLQVDLSVGDVVVWKDPTTQRVSENSEGNNIDRTVIIPPDHVWVEGDCPPFSLDSRHYGFIPKDWIKGRLLYRVWPLLKTDEEDNQIPFRVTQQRPIPFSSIDDYLGWRFNFHKVSKKQSKGDA
mmetsp:Transcript_20106/g.49356  ORF Transcript_20106/g.49356 Transcript_20106/m.49356 type:complete len:283 (+) Transcript_20106:123-971(+)